MTAVKQDSVGDLLAATEEEKKENTYTIRPNFKKK